MKKIIALVLLKTAITVSPLLASPPAPLPEEPLGPPVKEMESSGTVFKVFESRGIQIVTVTPENFPAPAFMSFVNPREAFKESDVRDFLSGFASSTGITWSPLDRSVPVSTLRFFLETPDQEPEKMEKVLQGLPDPATARKVWIQLAQDDRARAEAYKFLEMLEGQRQMWVSDSGGYVAVWSEDGTAIGVGLLPMSP